jgi:hypothetical protein
MLASTVQFSTYDQTPPHTPPPNPTTPRGNWRYENRDGPDTRQRANPLPQDPTACLRTEPPPPPRSTHPLKERRTSSSDRAGRTGQRSTLEHHPTHSARHP